MFFDGLVLGGERKEEIDNGDHVVHAEDDDDDDDSSFYGDVGAMFEGMYPTTMKRFAWWPNGSTSITTDVMDDKDGLTYVMASTKKTTAIKGASNRRELPIVRIVLLCIDEDPGAVRSGHYVWPASLALCKYLVSGNSTGGCNSSVTRSVIELGAGSGIVSLAALQLFVPTLELLVVTDHDRSTLERAEENYETTMSELIDCFSNDTTVKEKTTTPKVSSVRTEFLCLNWGSETDRRKLANCLNHKQRQQRATFDLVLGSDLIDCVEVVEPLFRTIESVIMRGDDGGDDDNDTDTDNDAPFSRCLLSQSFAYDLEVENEIDRVCDEFQLQRRILVDSLTTPETIKGGGAVMTKIQEFIPMKRPSTPLYA